MVRHVSRDGCVLHEIVNIVLEEVEETFEKNGQFGALCRLYEKANMKEIERKGGNSKLMVGVYEEKLLEAWAKSVVTLP